MLPRPGAGQTDLTHVMPCGTGDTALSQYVKAGKVLSTALWVQVLLIRKDFRIDVISLSGSCVGPPIRLRAGLS